MLKVKIYGALTLLVSSNYWNDNVLSSYLIIKTHPCIKNKFCHWTFCAFFLSYKSSHYCSFFKTHIGKMFLIHFLHNQLKFVLKCKLNANSHTNFLNIGWILNIYKMIRARPVCIGNVSCAFELFTLSRNQEFSFLDMMRLRSVLAITTSSKQWPVQN